MTERYYVAELEGRMKPAISGDYPAGLTVQVLDRAYLHRTVWIGRTEDETLFARCLRQKEKRRRLRAMAAAKCAELNAEDEEWR